jgi:hypothetical protein
LEVVKISTQRGIDISPDELAFAAGELISKYYFPCIKKTTVI